MKTFFNRLANKLIITFTITILIFVTVLIYVSYNRTNEILINDFINSNKSILRLLNQNYENYIAQIDELSIAFRKDAQFMEYLTSDFSSTTGELYLRNQIKNLFYSRNDIDQLQFFIPKNGMLYTISHRNDKLRMEIAKNLAGQNWYKKTIKGEYFRYIEPSVFWNYFTVDYAIGDLLRFFIFG